MERFCSDDMKDLAGAMLKVQAEISPALKDGDNPFSKSRYATLNSVVTASREALLRYGLWLVQYPVAAEVGHLGLVTKLVHASTGQWQSSLLMMPLPKADPQGYGFALTYARWYSLAMLVGLVVEDDDGKAACGGSKKGRSKAALNKSSGGVDVDRNQKKEGADPQPSSTDNEILKKLPHFDGINYQLVTVQDGQLCVIATGQTSAKKYLLSKSGFRWNPDRKIWWKYAA